MSKVPTVTLDVWHTLVKLAPAREDQYLQRQEAALAEVVGSSPRVRSNRPDPEVTPDEAARRAFYAANHRPGRGSPVVELVRDAARRAGRTPRPRQWLRAVEAYVAALPFEEVTGARSVLQRLRHEGYRTAVVSNLVGETGISMRAVLRKLDMDRFIESWAFSDELPWAKPAPQIFWHAIAPLDATPTEAVHVGDLGPDVQGARAAGFRGAVLFRGAKDYGARYSEVCRTNAPIEPPPDLVLDSWSDLPRLLDSLFPATRRRGARPPARGRAR
jgi:FMN phosphatase YigB (HAD superfamily)